MDTPLRYAIYYAPPPGPFASAASAWLGWDADAGREVAHPDLPGLPGTPAALTEAPRRYGFHGTLKPPFRLAPGATPDALAAAAAALAARLRPVEFPCLRFAAIGGFLALVPEGEARDLTTLAAAAVENLDRFRAPPDDAEIARRRPDWLSERQRKYLARWGYPYVMDEFRFHLTLTGDIGRDAAAETATALAPWFAPVLPRPFRIGELCLFAELPDGRFRVLHRYPLSG
ncbi:MAG: DUF1045 domain-containing protein [Paracoccaceae bacterium]